MKGTIITLAAALIAAPTFAQAPARAADPEAVHVQDVKCLAFAALLQRQPQTADAGKNLMVFFMGRVSASGRPVDIEQAVIEIRPDLANGIGPMRDRCGAVFAAASDLIKIKPSAAKP